MILSGLGECLIMISEEQKYKKVIEVLDSVSSSFCMAKWHQLTLYLQNGFNHSCHHPSPHKVPLDELKENYKALHNTKFKKEQMQKMLDGVRPSECDYCWRAEDAGRISDRVYKSGSSWAKVNFESVKKNKTADVNPAYVEISFSNVCNFKCAYCSPDLSSQWYDEIEANGPYPTSLRHNNFDWLKQIGKIPIKHNDYNPYVEAFWQWWPELYNDLHTLRLTGGEPLLSKDAWKMLSYIEENPNENLVFALNTNLCVPDELIDKLIPKIQNISRDSKEFQLFTSGEALGESAEYIRYGLDYSKWSSNLEKVLDNTNIIVAIMTTVNLTSVTSYADFIRYLLDLRGKYNKRATFNKVQFMTNFLRYPDFLALNILDQETKNKFSKDIDELIRERGNWDGFATLMFSEVDQLRRLLDFMNSPIEETKLRSSRIDFINFVNEYDKRRNLDFVKTFPQLEKFYKLCNEH
jgi:pyruvate-formate lyase-activating enzyme